jgi:hypothetical protein
MNSSPPASVGALEAPTIGATVADASDGSLPNPTNARDSRIEALDLVRFLAIIGMMVTHLLVPLAMADGVAAWERVAARTAEVVFEGSSSTLFAVVGGCSLVLATRSRMAAGDRRGAVLSGVIRGALVTIIGLLVGFVPSSVIGLGMMLTAPLLLCKDRVLVAIVALSTLVGAPVNNAVRSSSEIVQEIGNVTPLNLLEPVALVRGLALTGMYPLVTWLPYLLVGVLLMRSLLRAMGSGTVRRWSLRALTFGAGASVLAHAVSALAKAWARDVGVEPILVSLTGFGAPLNGDPWALLAGNPHTGTVTDMLATGGLAVALIGLLTLLLPPNRHLTSTPMRALRSAGAAPLTVYTVHVILTGVTTVLFLVLTGGEVSSIPWYAASVGILAIHLVLLVALGALLAHRGTRGPLEALLGRAVSRFAPKSQGTIAA